MKSILKILALLLVLTAVILIGREWIYQNNLENTVSADTSEVLFKIEQGETADQIAKKLADSDLVVSAGALTRYLKASKLDDKLRFGRYILARNLTIPELASRLTSDEAGQIKVRLPEGFTIAQMDEYLAEHFIINQGELIRCASECDFSDISFLSSEPDNVKQRLEGYLFPDTYFHDARSVTAKEIIHRALIEMSRKLEKLNIDQNRINEVLTMASLLEKETWTKQEKPVVAGILWARLHDGMRLDVDATTRYAVGKLKAPLTQQDLHFNDSYNTRYVHGLPPGPICAFSENSLRAATNPEETDYRYYLHDSDGVIHYAKTLEGHNLNVAKWLR
ncbi:MAG: endolytic transglycosylase MltG [Patescibacteria group bacterium]|nr:endolytic transglycosylase MltG [Patescibacteria group bacterium]